MTLSCAKNWWPDLWRLLYQLELLGRNLIKAQAIKHGCRKATSNTARKFPLYVNEFFIKRANSFMKTVMKKHFKLTIIGVVWSLHLVEEPYITYCGYSKEQSLLTGILQCIIAPTKSRITQQLCNWSPKYDGRCKSQRQLRLPTRLLDFTTNKKVQWMYWWRRRCTTASSRLYVSGM
jgi:hypothetical protein